MTNLDWTVVTSHFWDVFVAGTVTTLEVSVLSFAVAFGISIAGALGRRSGMRYIRWATALYVETFRNTPALVTIFMIYFGLAGVGLRLPNFYAGVLALGLTAGAYMTDIVRAGLQAVRPTQLEAAHALGLSTRQTFVRVWFPQALRNVYLPLVNLWIIVLLGSSLLTTIGVPELTHNTMVLYLDTFRPFEPFIMLTVIYLVLSSASSRLLTLAGKRMFAGW